MSFHMHNNYIQIMLSMIQIQVIFYILLLHKNKFEYFFPDKK